MTSNHRRLSSEVNGRTSTATAAGTSEPQCALQSLQAAFQSSTRVILATSLQVRLAAASSAACLAHTNPFEQSGRGAPIQFSGSTHNI